jgi:hypothetical protein
MNQPLVPVYHQGVVYIAEHNRITYVDLGGDMVLDPEIMTVQQLKQVLKERNLFPCENVRKNILQEIMKSWIKDNDTAHSEKTGHESDEKDTKADKTKYKRKLHALQMVE